MNGKELADDNFKIPSRTKTPTMTKQKYAIQNRIVTPRNLRQTKTKHPRPSFSREHQILRQSSLMHLEIKLPSNILLSTVYAKINNSDPPFQIQFSFAPENPSFSFFFQKQQLFYANNNFFPFDIF